ncbi:hypothetical protein BZ163_00590 [Pseudomonas sp. VI4.1]|nr:hypothetical protein BZ163_00590 [Pseudomonas sp. VI4.1]
MQPLKNWSHPFKDKDPSKDTRNPLLQLTHMAKAAAGYYPLGRSGLFHGGIHFDSGTAGALDQSSVHCLADGEVVAYRIDTQAPTTAYSINKKTVEKPFSRNFVLVRHYLQPPKIKGSPDTPPSLTFYSLYMHLQDWSVYHEDPTLTRPAFWPESPVRRVKQTVKDVRPGNLELRGLNVRTQDRNGKVIDLLPRGAEVTVSGKGDMRKLENSLGPANLISADGSLRGYVSMSEVLLIAGDDYYVKALGGSLNVYAEPSFHSEVLMELPDGTRFTLSGDDYYRKLERIDQYVHFASLQGEQKPLGPDRVVVLDTPVAIKAGELIGHLGRYQESGAEQPEQKLHLEVFSGDDVDSFIKASRDWAQRLPEKDRTWLKLAKGTAVVPHQNNVTAAQLKVLSAASPLSAADLLIPKRVLDGLPADRKIQVTASESRKVSNWYRLEGLLHGADNHLLKGWVREEVGVTPWVSPWSWEGYDIIDEYDVPQEFMASFLRAVKRLSEAQLERFGPMADEGDTGPLKTRLYDIIDTDRNGRMTAEELRTAISLPAHAQSISQLIVNCESEWYYKAGKWDRLDEVLGHSGSTPHLNWLAEKQRIKQMCWWGEVAAKVGLPAHGEVYYFHPVGLVATFAKTGDLIYVEEFLLQYELAHTSFSPGTHALTTNSKENLRKIVVAINKYYKSFPQKTNIYEVAYMLATVRHEAYYFLTGEFFSEKPEAGNLSYFNKYDSVLASDPELREVARKNGNTQEGDGYKYRGRGCVHLTWKNNYRKFSDLLSYDFVLDPDAAAKFEYSVPIMIIGMSKGMFTGKKLADYLALDKKDYLSARKIINGNDAKVLIASYAEKFEAILKKTSRLPVEY